MTPGASRASPSRRWQVLARRASRAARILILAWLETRPEQGCARAIADGYGRSRPLVANILKELCQRGFVSSRCGVKGGYHLARPASGITPAGLLDAGLVWQITPPVRCPPIISTVPRGPRAGPGGRCKYCGGFWALFIVSATEAVWAP